MTTVETAFEAGVETQVETHTRDPITLFPSVYLILFFFFHLPMKQQPQSKSKKKQ